MVENHQTVVQDDVVSILLSKLYLVDSVPILLFLRLEQLSLPLQSRQLARGLLLHVHQVAPAKGFRNAEGLLAGKAQIRQLLQ